MKGLVTETKDGYCAILREDGAFIRIKGNYSVGAEIDLSKAQADNVTPFAGRRFKTAVAAAAAALAVLVGVGGTKAYRDNMVSSYVTIDVKPSIEYSLNRDNLVLRAVALSDDAAPITEELNQKNIKGKSLENAIKQTIEIMKDKGYIEDGSEEILISVTSNDEKTAASLKETAETAAKATTGEGASVIAITVSDEERQNASKEGKSAARVELENGTLATEAVAATGTGSKEQPSADGRNTSAASSENTAAASSAASSAAASGTSAVQAAAQTSSAETSETPEEPASPGFAGGAVALTDPDGGGAASDAQTPSAVEGPQDQSSTSSAEPVIDIPAPDPIEYEGTTDQPGDSGSKDPEGSENSEGDIGFTGDPITVH